MSNIKRVIEVYDALKVAIDSALEGDLWRGCELWLGYRADLTSTATHQAKRVSVIRSNASMESSSVTCETMVCNGAIVIECQVAELQAAGSTGLGTIESRRSAYLVLDQLIDACISLVKSTPAYAAITNPLVTIEHDTDTTAPIYKAWLIISEQSYQSL